MVGAVVVVGDSDIGASVVGVIVDGDEDGGGSVVVGSSVRVVVIVDDVDSVVGDSVMEGASASIIVGANDGRGVGPSVGIVIVVVTVLATVAIVVAAVAVVVVGGIAVVEVATSSPSSAAVVASTSSIVPIDALPSTIVVVVVVALPLPTALSSTVTIMPSSTTPVIASSQADATSKLHGLAVINDDRKTSSSTSRPYFTISPVVGSIMSGTCISYHPSLDPHGLLGVDDDITTVELLSFDDDDIIWLLYIFGTEQCPMYIFGCTHWRETH